MRGRTPRKYQEPTTLIETAVAVEKVARVIGISPAELSDEVGACRFTAGMEQEPRMQSWLRKVKSGAR